MPSLPPNLAAAVRSLRMHSLRSALTVLAVGIGIGSVVLLLAIGKGVERDVRGELDRIGTNLVVVLPGVVSPTGVPDVLALATLSSLTEQDVADVARVPGVVECMPIMLLAPSVERVGRSHAALVVGVTARMPSIAHRTLSEGRFFTASEEREPVCVLAHATREALFALEPAVGRTVSIRGKSYRVVGVMAPEPPTMMATMNFSNIVCVPAALATRRFEHAQVDRIAIKTAYERDPTPLLESIRKVLRRNHGHREDFSVLTQEQVLGMVYRVLGIVAALLAGVSAVSLVVAGVGVMNVMLITVTERTREIGIRKTVGARRRDVFVQFLSEAVALCLLGGAAGLALAQVACFLASAHTPLRPIVTWHGVLLAVGVCTSVGLVFGVAPAARAARQSPIEALRHE